jgi:hypothetical protein
MRLVSSISFVLFISACASKGDEGMFILNNSAPPAGAVCVFTGDPAQPFTAAGEISFDSPQGYFFSPLIESRITAVAGSESERTIHLEGADVTLTVANSSTNQKFTALFSGSVAPNGGTTNVGFELMPTSSIAALGNVSQNVEVVAEVDIYGTLGGGRIDGEPFQYPITIVGRGKGIVNVLGSCAVVAGSSTVLGNACNQLQDGVVDCCSCGDPSKPVCPAPAVVNPMCPM